jgi:carbon starvation protein
MFAGGCVVLLLGYRIYGRFLERQFDVDGSRPVPSETMKDGVDYVTAKTPVLFGHHFSSIAGAGPIVGPITAGLAFGWLPPFIWLLVGAVFVGGTHDFAALMASIRHRARSIGEICRIYLSGTTYRLFLGFVWLALVYVLVVFLDLTASTFAPNVAAIADQAKQDALVHAGGTVATASLTYIGLALVFGLIVNTGRVSLKAGSAIFVPLVFLALVAAQDFPLTIPGLMAGTPKATWSILLLGYCFAASILPVWLLLQPRDYLSSFLLYACVIGGGAGLVISSLTSKVVAHYPAFVGFTDPGLGHLFPAMFIVIACGAISGFHSIVASGTTAKQLPSESAARPVAYGAMITEAVVGLVALAAIMLLSEKPVGTPTAIFSQGIGQFLSVFGIPAGLGAGFGLLAVSTFLLTTLDTCTRLARYVFEEMFGVGGRTRYLSTALTLALPLAIVFVKIPDPAKLGACLPAWQAVWPVFGATNQLLAAMALLVIFVWRSHQRKPKWFIVWPMILMFAITGTGLVQLLRSAICSGQVLIAVLSGVLMAMALALLVDTARSWRKITSVAAFGEGSASPR